MLDQLVGEHRIAREEVKALHEAAQRYERGDMDAVEHIIRNEMAVFIMLPLPSF
jgi:hemerythrin-like domain-containing protein